MEGEYYRMSHSPYLRFEAARLFKPLSQSLKFNKYITMTNIQQKALSLGLRDLNVVLHAPAESGKTLAYIVLLLNKMQLHIKKLQAIVFAPTPKVVMEIYEVLCILSNGWGLRRVCLTGSDSKGNDVHKMESANIVVGTPARVMYAINKLHLDVSMVRVVVFDKTEAVLAKYKDTLFENLAPYFRRPYQIIFTSESEIEKIYDFQNKYYITAVTLRDTGKCQILTKVLQLVLPVKDSEVKDDSTLMRRKVDEIHYLLNRVFFKQCLIFVNSDEYGRKLKQMMTGADKHKKTRSILSICQLRSDRTDRDKLSSVYIKQNIIVLTNQAAKRLDKRDVDFIINAELPFNYEAYFDHVAAVGKYGRFGNAVTIGDDEELNKLREFFQREENRTVYYYDKRHMLSERKVESKLQAFWYRPVATRRCATMAKY